MLIPSSESARNILLAMPTWLRMPMPTMETLQILVSPSTRSVPRVGTTLVLSTSRQRAYSLRCTVKLKSVLPSWLTFWMMTSTSMLASATAPRIW